MRLERFHISLYTFIITYLSSTLNIYLYSISGLPLFCYFLIVVLTFALQTQVPYKTYFQLSALEEYLPVVSMEHFMEKLAPTVWPTGKRGGIVLNLFLSIRPSNQLCQLCLNTWEHGTVFTA